eukprot:s203_g17.t1
MACCASEQVLASADSHESWERDDLILQSSSQGNPAQSRPMACCAAEQVLASADSPDPWDRDDLKETGGAGDSQLVQVEVESESPGFSPSSRLAKKVQAKTGANKKKDANPEQTLREPWPGFVADGPLDVLAGFIILVNAIVLMVEMQYRAAYAEEILGMYPTIPQTVDRPEIFETIEYIFLAFYEGLIWGNYFDALIVAFGVIDVLVQKVALPQEGLRTVRVQVRETHFGAVLLRLLKVFKLTKTLRLVRDTFFASLSSLFWSMIMLLVCMLIAALILCESVVPLIVETSTNIGIDRREWLFIRYGSFFRAMYTMFEITFSGGWPGLVRPLVDEVSVLFVIPTLIYVVAIVFAALRLITALFVRSTMQVLNDDAAAAILDRMRRLLYRILDDSGAQTAGYQFPGTAILPAFPLQDKLLQVFNDADADGDGYLTLKDTMGL